MATDSPEQRSRRRATSYDVARAAGVSQSAVSRCFAPRGSIAAATRARVLEAANELGYRPNALAQGLISGRSNLVALLISNLTNLYYPEVLAELTRRLSEQDLRVLLFSLSSESEVDAVLDQIWRHSVTGVIAAARLSNEQIQEFADHRVPVILYNRASPSPLASSVACNSVSGERLLVQRLLAGGHRRFGIIAGPKDSFVGEERRVAAMAALEEGGITGTRFVRGDFSYPSGVEGLRELRNKSPKLDAVVCVNDLMAIGAIDSARDSFSLSVPGDLSVVGFDGSAPASWSSYQVTSIRQPVRRMTKATVDMLMEQIEDDHAKPERRLFEGQLVEGASARLGEAAD